MSDPTQAPDADFRDRAAETLQAAKPGDLIVVALLSQDGGAIIHTANPDALLLTNLAASLLDAAHGLLHEAGQEESDLGLAVRLALDELPDRFESGEG